MDSLTLISRPIDVMKLKSFSQVNTVCYNGDTIRMNPPVQNKGDMLLGSETKSFTEIFPRESSFPSMKKPSDVECVPMAGSSLQPTTGHLPCVSTPLVAFVNPTATSLMSQTLKPVSSTSNSSPVCSSSQSAGKNNLHQQSAQQLIFVKSSVSQPKSDTYVITAGEKSNSFMKPASQTFFGNDCTKLIPVATIVPNNASLITNSKKNVNSDLHREPALTSQNFKQFKDDKISLNTKMSLPHSSSMFHSNSSNILTTSPSVPSPLIFSSYNSKPELSDHTAAMSQPLNLTLQVVPQPFTNIESKNSCSNQVRKSKYVPVQQFYHPNMALHSLPNPHPTLNQTNQLQMFYSPVSHSCFTPPSISYNQFQNQTIPLRRSQPVDSNFALGSPYGQYINPGSQEQNSNPVSQAHQINPVLHNHPITHNSSRFTQGAFSNTSVLTNPVLLNTTGNCSDPPLALKIDSIYSLADNSENKCDLNLVPSTLGFKSSKLGLSISGKISTESKENVKTKRKPSLQRPRGRPPQKTPKFVNKKQREIKPKRIKASKPLRESKSVFSNNLPISREDITVSCHANDFESLKPITDEERKLNSFFKYLGLCRSSTVNTDKSKKCCDLSGGGGGKISSHCYVSRELARCFSCYLVVPKLNLPSDFSLMNTNDCLATVKTSEKCSKECRHNFLSKLGSTTGIVPRSGEIDFYWKIIPEIAKCSHTRKKYCRKSKMKAITNGIGSECKCVGCVSCPSKKPVNHGKINYLKKKVKTDISSPRMTVLKGIREKITTKYSKNEFTSRKLDKNLKTEDSKQFNNGFRTDKIMYPIDKKKKLKSETFIGKADIKKVGNGPQECKETINTLLYHDKPHYHRAVETTPRLTFSDTPKPLTELDIPPKNNLPLIGSSCDSSDRIKRLKEILKEQQRDLEIARQYLKSNERQTENFQSITN